ncbi:hypothetical protein BCEP4_40036 [Burkholderia cepacia]|nr:hypothetical protein BCEP4_40036 [Burkholderia cepacia]
MRAPGSAGGSGRDRRIPRFDLQGEPARAVLLLDVAAVLIACRVSPPRLRHMFDTGKSPVSKIFFSKGFPS